MYTHAHTPRAHTHTHTHIHARTQQVKKEVETMLVRRVNDQVAEAVFEHKGASSLLTWFDSGQGKVCLFALRCVCSQCARAVSCMSGVTACACVPSHTRFHPCLVINARAS